MNNLSDDLCLKFDNLKITEKTTKMSRQDYDIAKKGDIGQGERLVNSKKK
jgi:hypothetical protein